MISGVNTRTALTYTKNFVSEQNFTKMNRKITTSSTFDVTLGFGEGASNSTCAILAMGGFDDQRVTAVGRWTSPNTTVTYELGVIARVQTMRRLSITPPTTI